MEKIYRGEYIEEHGYYVEEAEEPESNRPINPNDYYVELSEESTPSPQISETKYGDKKDAEKEIKHEIEKYTGNPNSNQPCDNRQSKSREERGEAGKNLLKALGRICDDFRAKAINATNRDELLGVYYSMKRTMINLHSDFVAEFRSNKKFESFVDEEFNKLRSIRNIHENWRGGKKCKNASNHDTNSEESRYRESTMPVNEPSHSSRYTNHSVSRNTLPTVSSLVFNDISPRRALHRDFSLSRSSSSSRMTITSISASSIRMRSSSVLNLRV